MSRIFNKVDLDKFLDLRYKKDLKLEQFYH
jgi:hypothetical protein